MINVRSNSRRAIPGLVPPQYRFMNCNFPRNNCAQRLCAIYNRDFWALSGIAQQVVRHRPLLKKNKKRSLKKCNFFFEACRLSLNVFISVTEDEFLESDYWRTVWQTPQFFAWKYFKRLAGIIRRANQLVKSEHNSRFSATIYIIKQFETFTIKQLRSFSGSKDRHLLITSGRSTHALSNA